MLSQEEETDNSENFDEAPKCGKESDKMNPCREWGRTNCLPDAGVWDKDAKRCACVHYHSTPIWPQKCGETLDTLVETLDTS